MDNPPTNPPENPAWHTRTADEAKAFWRTDRDGLAEDEAGQRLTHYGPNALPAPPRANALVRFLRHFHNILIYILLFAALGTALLGHWVDTGVILAVVLINPSSASSRRARRKRPWTPSATCSPRRRR